MEDSAGGFVGFPVPSVPHRLRDPHEYDLLYPMGAENLDVGIANFPRLGERMCRRGREVEIHGMSDAQSLVNRSIPMIARGTCRQRVSVGRSKG
jgi:hypothetical protein